MVAFLPQEGYTKLDYYSCRLQSKMANVLLITFWLNSLFFQGVYHGIDNFLKSGILLYLSACLESLFGPNPTITKFHRHF